MTVYTTTVDLNQYVTGAQTLRLDPRVCLFCLFLNKKKQLMNCLGITAIFVHSAPN